MSTQYKEIAAWKCHACGRVLTTRGGLERHKERCKFVIPAEKGQISIEELMQKAQNSK